MKPTFTFTKRWVQGAARVCQRQLRLVACAGGADGTDRRGQRVFPADDSRGGGGGAAEGREGYGNGRWRNGRHGRNGLLGY